ncbi:Xaa-Pro peptidase family protein [Clostridiaceae bacterium M8S5]|nr:Xaa-Pro peptidase family protein [Clostridiaceae bacterium M8S5]
MNKKYLDKLVSIMNNKNIDAMLIAPSEDMEFLLGFSPHMDERFQSLFILNDSRCFYIVPKLNFEEIEKVIGNQGTIYQWDDGEGFMSAVNMAFDEHDLIGKTIGVNKSATAVSIIDIKEKLEIEFINGNQILEELRLVKNDEEVNKLRKAARLADDVFADIVKFIKPGITEKDICEKMKELFIEKGADGLSFSPIIASGANSSKPHYNDYSRVIQEKDIIILDFGCKCEGLCSDMTRTVFVGGISEKEEIVYNAVMRANLAGEEQAKPGVQAQTVDKSAREVIKEAGYGEYFITRTGHGIGYSVHEAPYIKSGNEQILEKGMAFSVEPGIYIPNEFGVRIEDIVVVTEDGVEVLNKSEKKPVVIK